jgi:hypothetical protein
MKIMSFIYTLNNKNKFFMTRIITIEIIFNFLTVLIFNQKENSNGLQINTFFNHIKNFHKKIFYFNPKLLKIL